jgi:3-phenylpropionate/trans-cinnamate dioxygenase ferredoxin reductase subunit
MPERIVIVGGGQAAAIAARTLRRRKFTGSITVIGEEPHAPYQRPPLSKEYLAGEQDLDEVVLLDEDFCAAKSIEVMTGTRVERIDAAAGRAELTGGGEVPGDAFLLATGSRARRLPGVEGERVIYLRTMDDATRLRGYLQPGARIVLVGGGFIGSEVASTARKAGAEVTVLEALDVPFERILGADMGQLCAQLQRDHGVDLRTGQTVESVDVGESGVTVRTGAGDVVEGDVVVIGIGTVPNVEVAERSGIDVDGGVLVDEYCRTSVENIWAAGDVVNAWQPSLGRRLRVEHFDNASKQGMAAAKNMLGQTTAYDDPHWFWSDQFGLNLQQSGVAERWDQVVVRGSIEDRDFMAFYLDAGVVRAAFAIERGGDMYLAQQMILAQAAPDPAKLADEDVELAELMTS